jgi:hypothetical protein
MCGKSLPNFSNDVRRGKILHPPHSAFVGPPHFTIDAIEVTELFGNDVHTE